MCFERQHLFSPRISTSLQLKSMAGGVLKRAIWDSIYVVLHLDRGAYSLSPVEFSYDLNGDYQDVVVVNVDEFDSAVHGSIDNYRSCGDELPYGQVIQAVQLIRISRCYQVAFIPENQSMPFYRIPCEDVSKGDEEALQAGHYLMHVGVVAGIALQFQDHVVVADSYEGEMFSVQVRVLKKEEFYMYVSLPHVSVLGI